jgi:PAS domain S-box-containing protein
MELIDQSQQKLDFALKAARMASWDLHLQSNRMNWSSDHYRLLGYEGSKFEPTIQHVRSRVHPSDLARFDEALRLSVEHGIDYEAQYRICLPDDSSRWLQARGCCLSNERGIPVSLTGVVFDITGLKEAENALRASERRFRALVNAVPSITWSAAPDGSITWASNQWFEYTGLDPKQDSLQWPRLVLHPDDYEPCARKWAESLRDGSEYSIEVRYRRHDGIYRWFLCRAVPVRDENDRPVAWFGTTTDIHDRQLAEETLRQSESRFRQLADAMPQIAWTARADGFLNYFNKRWYEYTGFEQREGEVSWLTILHPEDADKCEEAWNGAVKSGQPFQIEYRFRDRKTGGYRWHLGRALPVRDEHGRIVNWFGTCTDIDDQKRAEERVIRLNEILISVLEAIPDIVFVTALDGRIEFRNPAADRFMSAAGLEGLPAAIRSELERVLQTGEHHLPTDFKAVHRFVVDNSERFFLSRIVGMITPENQVFGAVAMLQDVTEFCLLDEVKTNLIATVSHELKTPITSVRTALLVLLEQTFGPLNPQQLELLGAARDEGERLLRTLNTLLDLTRFEDGAVGMRVEQLLPEDLVNRAVEEVETVAGNAFVTITTEFESDLPRIEVDREHILHVLTNFLTNAIRYSPPEAKVSVRARRQGEGICFSVIDHGPGVPEEYHSRIFERFFRVPGMPKQGAGLGLWIAREFVRAHGGGIGLVSQPDNGSEFFFVLPIKRS